ncbi:hypothetical protein MKW92_039384 [Papaver armeniacum]|nr:hypothetical protein MKW92_039384 [Papaver armeniacum]
MASSTSTSTSFILFVCFFHLSSATGRKLNELVQDKPAMPLHYHNGRLLSGQTSINLIWYGNFTPAQTASVYMFFNQFFTLKRAKTISTRATLKLYPNNYSKLKKVFEIDRLVSRSGVVLRNKAINVVLTSVDAAVFCSSRCGSSGSSSSPSTKSQFAYIWVGISEIRCPEICASPFLQSIYDVSPAGMTEVQNLASLLIQNLRP